MSNIPTRSVSEGIIGWLWFAQRTTAILIVVCFATASGCASMGSQSATSDTGSRSTLFPSTERDDDGPEESDGLEWSDFSLDKIGRTTKKLTGRGPNRKLARELYQTADAEYRQAADAQGEGRAGLFAAAAPKFSEAADRWPDSALAMDGLFMAGESYFFADNYPMANKQYEKLVKAFPNNKYMDVVNQRRFAIAKYWLDTDRESPEQFYYVNFFDGTRPWKDARGSGLRVFDKIRIDDPIGKFADDATLAAGNEHFSRGKFYKADEFYSDLRKTYPSSEHQFLAHFLGLKAKLGNYGGPAYSGAPLDEAEKLIKQMRRQFPQESEQEREFLDRAAAEVRYLQAQRLDYLAKYYDRRSEYGAARHYYARIVKEYDDTPIAAKAQERATQIADLPGVPDQALPWLVAMFPESDPVKPLIEATERARQQETAIAAGQAETVQR